LIRQERQERKGKSDCHLEYENFKNLGGRSHTSAKPFIRLLASLAVPVLVLTGTQTTRAFHRAGDDGLVRDPRQIQDE
jgi:hypothetical protein